MKYIQEIDKGNGVKTWNQKSWPQMFRWVLRWSNLLSGLLTFFLTRVLTYPDRRIIQGDTGASAEVPHCRTTRVLMCIGASYQPCGDTLTLSPHTIQFPAFLGPSI